MRRLITQAILAVMILGTVAVAQNPGTFEEAKALSAKNGLPILVEFVRSD